MSALGIASLLMADKVAATAMNHLTRIALLLTTLLALPLPAETIRSESGNYSVESPARWTVSRGMTKEAVFFCPETRNGFRCNMVFIEEPMGRSQDLKEMVDLSLPQLRRLAPDAQITSRTTLRTESGAEMVRVTYTASLFVGKPPMNNVAYLTIVGGHRLLTITVSALADTSPQTLAEAEASALSVQTR